MSNELAGRPEHSAEHFGDTRDHWWNVDQLALLARHWRLGDVRRVLDVGCGVGHWGRALAQVLPGEARVTGIDREPQWAALATRRAPQTHAWSYATGDAAGLPFADGAFDLVTCQTLLMHVPRPERVLAEMVRVVRPGGLIVAAEPTNFAGVVNDSVALDDDPTTAADLLRFYLACLRGKRALGEGDDLLGERLPTLLAGAGLRDVDLRQNDRAWPMLPPYARDFERAAVDEALVALERELWVWTRTTTARYFRAAGGTDAELDRSWRLAIDQRRRAADAIRAGTYSCAGGGLFYIGWGWRSSD